MVFKYVVSFYRFTFSLVSKLSTGMGMEARSLALRVSSLVALFYGHIVCTTHSFGLLAHLTASWSEPQVNSLEDALQRGLPVHLLGNSNPVLSRDVSYSSVIPLRLFTELPGAV